ncbi:hypothetical protein [Sphingomonas cavernae]|nr:hypothetical protein [Sphingomonas cavernae]
MGVKKALHFYVLGAHLANHPVSAAAVQRWEAGIMLNMVAIPFGASGNA